MSWFSKLTGVNIDLSRPLKKAANEALNEHKVKVIEAITEWKEGYLKKTVIYATDNVIRAELHEIVNKLGLPAYLLIPVSIAIDTVKLNVLDGSRNSVIKAIDRETARIVKQIQGARF